MFLYLHETIPYALKMYNNLFYNRGEYLIVNLFRPVFFRIMLFSITGSLSFLSSLFDLFHFSDGMYYFFRGMVGALLYAGSIWAMMSMQEILNKYIEKNNKEEANYKVHITEIIIIVLINPFVLWCILK